MRCCSRLVPSGRAIVRPSIEGFHSAIVSRAGLNRAIVRPPPVALDGEVAGLAGQLSGPPLKRRGPASTASGSCSAGLAGQLSGPPLKEQLSELVAYHLASMSGLAGQLSGPPLKAIVACGRRQLV